ncbi:MAG: SMR family transporter [Eubacteriales bacterium]|nr:SMR family transporter [Eubacteriales bacterium]
MIYLILAVLSSALVGITMRLGKNYCKNDLSMLAVNYVCCTLLAGISTGAGNFVIEKTSIGLGVIQGILYLASFILYQYNIQENGVVLSATFMKLGVLVPTLAAVILFGEQPTSLQLLGVGLSLFAIIIMNYQKGEGGFHFKMSLLFLLLAGGVTDVMAKVYEQYGDAGRKDQFIFYTFCIAMILCIALALYKKEKLTGKDVLWGVVIGVPNYFSAVFLLRAIHHVLATIAYSSYSVGTIACTTLVGVFVFREKLSKKQMAGLFIILIALICLNFN